MSRRLSCSVQLRSQISKRSPRVWTQNEQPASLFTWRVSTITNSTLIIVMTSSNRSSIITGTLRRPICQYMQSKIVLTNLRQRRQIFRKIVRCSPWKLPGSKLRIFTQRKAAQASLLDLKSICKTFIKLSFSRRMLSCQKLGV